MNGKAPLAIGTILALIGVVTFALSFRSSVLKDSAEWQGGAGLFLAGGGAPHGRGGATAFSLAEGSAIKGRMDRAERDIERLWQTVSQQRKEIAEKLEKIFERLPYPPGGGPR